MSKLMPKLMSQPKYRILIIEDEALVVHELRGRLDRMGFDVVGVASGSEAVALARETLPDLLLTDIHLKNAADGIDVALAIQRERRVPVVFLTAYSDEETVSRAKAVTPYGFIIKPVDYRELQIAIDLALYNFNIEQELRETQQLLQNALACIGNALVFLDETGLVSNLNSDAQRLLGTEHEQVIGQRWHDVLALKTGSSVFLRIESALKSSEVSKLSAFILNSATGLSHLVDGVVGPMLPGAVLILRELSGLAHPLESLPTNQPLRSKLGSESLGVAESAMCQLAIGVRRAFGQGGQSSAVDGKLLQVLAQRLDRVLRATDLVSALGDDQLSVSLPHTSLEAGKKIAQMVLKALKGIPLDHDNLQFSIGLAQTDAGEQQPFELFRRANWALNVAQESGGDRVIVWNDASDNKASTHGSQSLRRREYDNVVLLWNVMSLVMKAGSAKEMSDMLCRHLLESFDLVHASVLMQQAESLEALGGALSGGEFTGIKDLELTAKDFERINNAWSKAIVVNFNNSYVLPVAAGFSLYLQAKLPLDTAGIDFLRTLLRYFATGLTNFDRIVEVRGGDDAETLVYQSAQMRSVLDSCRLVAPTDATVLITGESGTGKELLARAIHDMSSRADKPFVIVDCGAVVGNLIESELFGHVKGAFTGADKHFSGRLKEADGGTILLDEIGELPLDIQVKLLRYVQNRQIVAVGSSVYNKVDTRILAATNKNLKALIEIGDFREDLYYRLNVFAIESPALRDRPDDIILLAKHYLKVFERRYGKSVAGFTRDAEQALSDYGWPGNIRELINVINRAVILCKDSQLNSIHLGLFPESHGSKAIEPQHHQFVSEEAQTVDRLSSWMKSQVTLALADPKAIPSLGPWLEEDLILACMTFNQEVLIRAAQALDMPESTLRRKVARMRKKYSDGIVQRPANWYSTMPTIDCLLQLAASRRQPLLEMVSQALIKELESQPIHHQDAARLFGVSLPTYRRLRADLS